MTKKYQKTAPRTSAELRHGLPEMVSVAMNEICEDVQEGLLAMAVGAGLQVMAAMMSADVEAVCGPKGRHNADRVGVRHGTENGSVTLGGRRVPVERPRMRAADGSGELSVPAYELFSQTEVLGRMAMARMLGGLSTRRYPIGLEPVGAKVEQAAGSTSKSAVSRRFVAATETALAQLLAADLSGLDLVALMVDGVHFGEHLCVVALGIGIDGTKYPLGLAEGSHGEHHGGHRAADRAAGAGPGHDASDLRRHRWWQGVAGRGAAGLRSPGDRSVSAAQAQECGRQAARSPGLDGRQADARRLPRRLGDPGPGAARGAGQGTGAHPPRRGRVLREGLAETLTVLRLGVPPTLARTLRSTNSIESMISIARDHSTNVKNWQSGNMALRWCAAGMIEAGKQFRRVNGHLHLPALRVALNEHVAAQTVSTTRHDEPVIAA